MNLRLRDNMRVLLVTAIVLAAAALPTAVRATGRPTTETVVTDHFTKSVVLADNPPCVGTVTYDVRDVFHITYSDGDIAHITNSQTGDVIFVSDVDGQTYTGKFQGTFNLQSNRSNYSESSTYHLRVNAPDGSRLRFMVTFHGTFIPGSDVPTVEVIETSCSAT